MARNKPPYQPKPQTGATIVTTPVTPDTAAPESTEDQTLPSNPEAINEAGAPAIEHVDGQDNAADEAVDGESQEDTQELPPADGETAEGTTEEVVEEVPTSAPVAPPAMTSARIVEEPLKANDVELPKVDVPVITNEETDPRQAYLKKIEESGSTFDKNVLQSVKALYEALTPRRPITDQSGASAQDLFLRWVEAILSKPIEEARSAWNILLVFFDLYHGDKNSPSSYTSLSEYRAADFASGWNGQHERYVAYVSVIGLLRATRKVEGRKAAFKEFLIEKLGESVFTEDQRSKVKRIYAS